MKKDVELWITNGKKEIHIYDFTSKEWDNFVRVAVLKLLCDILEVKG